LELFHKNHTYLVCSQKKFNYNFKQNLFCRCSHSRNSALQLTRQPGCFSVSLCLPWNADCSRYWLLLSRLENHCLDLHDPWMYSLHHDLLLARDTLLAYGSQQKRGGNVSKVTRTYLSDVLCCHILFKFVSHTYYNPVRTQKQRPYFKSYWARARFQLGKWLTEKQLKFSCSARNELVLTNYD
jgi:hypothetical protein